MLIIVERSQLPPEYGGTGKNRLREEYALEQAASAPLPTDDDDKDGGAAVEAATEAAADAAAAPQSSRPRQRKQQQQQQQPKRSQLPADKLVGKRIEVR